MDLEAATRAVDKLLRAGRSGHATALDRLGRQRGWVMRSDAELTIAREHGYRSWLRLVEALTAFTPATLDDVLVTNVEKVTVLPFLADGSVVLIDERDRHRLPAALVQLADTALVDAAVQIALTRANLRSHTAHVFGTADRGRHLAVWLTGTEHADHAHTGRSSPIWWTGTPADAAELLKSERAPGLADVVLLGDNARRTSR